jgi:phage-related protein
MDRPVRRRWRDCATPAGRRPVKEFIASLSDHDAAAVVAAMKDVRQEGISLARRLRGPIYEVVADGENQTFRILFAHVGLKGRVLLALDAFSKKTRKAPPARIQLAMHRLADWNRRAARS